MSAPTLPQRHGNSGSLLDRLDDRLGTRPLFSALFSRAGLPATDRAIVVFHTLRTLVALHSGRLLWAVLEAGGDLWYRRIRGGRPGLRGLVPLGEPANEGWSNAVTPAAVHRCRIAFGRLRGRYGRASVTLFCGYSPRAGDLPVYVLMREGRIVDMAFSDGDGRISPGIGKVPQSAVANLEALRTLSARLAGGVPDEGSVRMFFESEG